jgi:geranylgeranyl diphosphate synthase, type I
MEANLMPSTDSPAEPGGGPAPEVLVVTDRVEARLSALLADERLRWGAIDADLEPPLSVLEQAVLAGGKRLRPTFCYWGFVAGGGDPASEAGDRMERVGAAFELLHAFALVHDDIMDGAALRRGIPTSHAVFSAEHEREGWRGETRRFGEAVAILIGDLAHSYAETLVHDLAPEARAIWQEVQIELMMGQYLDVLRAAAGRAELGQADRIARLKSGRYTIERPLQLGASIADAPASVTTVLSAYGLPLGMAFQLRDDVLGAFGDPARTGKPVGDDLREGKPTPMLAVALERASAAERAVLDRAGAADLTDAEVSDMQQIVMATGALAEIEVRIAQLTDAAVRAVHRSSFAQPVRDALVQLAEFVAGRER